MKKYEIILLGLVLTACSGETEQNNGSDGVEKEQNDQIEVHEDVLSAEKELIKNDPDLKDLRLNDGEKWVLDTASINGIARLDSTLQADNLEDMNLLGWKTKEKIQYMMQKCATDGEGRDHFYDLLNAMIKESKAMRKQKSNDTALMEHYIEVFHTFFKG